MVNLSPQLKTKIPNIFLLLIGLFLGIGLSLSIHVSEKACFIFVGGVVGATLFVLNPEKSVLLYIFGLLILEEFPSLQGETTERSQLSFFYGKSFGIPGFYMNDLVFFGLIFLLLVRHIFKPPARSFHFDGIAWALVVLFIPTIVSTVLSFLSGNPFDEGKILQKGVEQYLINDRGAKYIAFFQFKVYSFMIFAYLLGQLYLTTPKRIENILKVIFSGVIACLIIGAYRIITHPHAIAQGLPLFFHDVSSWFFALVTCYSVLAIGYDLWTPRWKNGMLFICFILMFFVLASYRRSLWGASLMSFCTLPFFLPRGARLKNIFKYGCVAFILFSIFLVSPAGSNLISSVTDRVQVTGIGDSSTLYRLFLLHHMIKHFADIPTFGYGATPLWGQMIESGIVKISLENIHNIFLWILLRTGWVGSVISFFAGLAITLQIGRFIVKAKSDRYRILAICIFLGICMFSFNGIFQPLYGHARYMILLGFSFAMVTRMRQFESSSQSENYH